MDSQTGSERQPKIGRSPAAPLRVDVVRAETNLFRIILSGELDLVTVGQLRDALAPLYQPKTTVMMELDKLTFLALCGVQAIVDAHRAAVEAGAALTVVVAPEHRVVTRVLAITGLDQVLTLATGDVPL